MNYIKNDSNFNSQGNKLNTDNLDYRTSELGTSKRLLSEYGHNLLHCEPLGGWFHWTGVRWKVDNNAIHSYAEQLARTLLVEAADADRSEQDQLIAHAKHMLKDKGLNAIANRAKKDSNINVDADIFDANPYYLNVENGTIDIRTGAIHDHRREDYITKLAPVMYDPTATASQWEQFLEQVLPDEEVRKYVQKASGQALTGTVEEQALYVNHGTGKNGKSTFFDTIFAMLGDYAGVIDADVLMDKGKVGGPTPEIMFLMSKRMVIASENSQGTYLNESMIKKLTGDAYLTGRNPYGKKMVTFERQFKIFMHVNHRPEIKGTDHAIWRRQRLVPWTVTIAEEAIDKHLHDKLKDELSGILNWCLDGYQLYAEEGLEPPEAVEAATDQYRDDMDKVGQFLKDECVTEDQPSFDGSTEPYQTKDRLYQAYRSWCEANGVYPEKKSRFGERMFEHGYKDAQKKVNGKNCKIWKGIGLLG